MKKIHLIYAACLLVGMGACAASVQKQVKDNFDVWKEYNTGAILFEDKAPETLGSDIYHRIIPDAESYIKEQARTVLATLIILRKIVFPQCTRYIILWKISTVFLLKAVAMVM